MVVNCPSCQKPLATKPVHAGRTIRCPACRGAVPVPLDLPEDAEDAPPAAPVPVVPKNAFDFDSPGPAATKRANRDEEEDDEDEDKPRYKRADETPPQWLLAAAAFPILLLANPRRDYRWGVRSVCGGSERGRRAPSAGSRFRSNSASSPRPQRSPSGSTLRW